MDTTDTNIKLKQLEDENNALREKLKSYTAPKRSKDFYEKHKENIKKKNKEYAQKTNYYASIPPEKKKEYARTAYLNKKAKENQKNQQLESI